MPLPSEINEQIDTIAADRVSGATALVLRGITLLHETAHDRDWLRDAARALCRSQPSMAGFRTACALALSAEDPRRDLEALAETVRRAPSLIADIAAPLIRRRPASSDLLTIVTCSRSAAMEQTVLALSRRERVRVCCAESRPRREGVALARALYQSGIEVHLYSDAGISAAMPRADAFLVGADAVAGNGFINKVGTAALAALARSSNLPVLVLAGREKVLPDAVYVDLPLAEGTASELEGGLPEHAVRNPYFERVKAKLLSQLITDQGAVSSADVSMVTLWNPSATSKYLSVIRAYNMLDNG